MIYYHMFNTGFRYCEKHNCIYLMCREQAGKNEQRLCAGHFGELVFVNTRMILDVDVGMLFLDTLSVVIRQR